MPSTASKHELHPAAELFPLMTEAEFAGLKADIQEHGQREDIISWKGKIIDGRNRLRACQELGIDPDIAELKDEIDPYAYVISHNLHRRHLSTSQRSSVAASIANLKHGGDRKSDQESNCTLEESAKLLNVSVDSVKRAKTVKEKGTPELAAMVRDGKVSVDAAAKVASKPKVEQKAIVDEGPKAVKEAAAAVPKKVPKGSGVPKQVEAADAKCSRCKKYVIEVSKLKAETKRLSQSLSYAQGLLSDTVDAGLFPFLDKCQKFWNEADDIGKAAINDWLARQKIVPVCETKESKAKDWRPAPVEVVVEVQS